MPFTLAGPCEYQELINKSRFLVKAAPIQTPEQAQTFLQSVADPSATHNCWAWKIGQQYRFSDDGEPGGTAGRPMLSAIEGQDCDRVVVVVTRWFGGILLGSGGLMRAYGGTAATCLRQAEKSEVIPLVGFRFACDFSDHALLKARLTAVENLAITEENFTGTGVELAGLMPIAAQNDLSRLVTDLTRGKTVIKFDD